MAVISEVKCGRCDRRYSGFRSRCPYCGARRNKRGKRADEGENAKAKMIIGVALLVVLIGATMVLLFTSIPKQSPEASASPSVTTTDAGPALTDNENVTGIESTASPSGEPVSPSASPSVSPSPESSATVQSVAITYTGKPTTDFTMKRIGETLQLRFKTTPDTQGKTATWESSNSAVATVVDGKVTAVGKGTATLKCTVDGIVAEASVHVRGVQ